jgi:hypothetical protein
VAVYTANDQRDQVLAGDNTADTFYTGHNSVIVTTGGGADTIVYQYLPWNNTGHITDFTLGTDKLDFSALFSASGYAGSDPVADGYVRFDADGRGGTHVYYDPDGYGTGYQWPTLVTTLDHVSPQGLTAAQLFNPTPTPPPPTGERTDLTDGGYVELWYDTAGGTRTFHVQKYNAAGSRVGAEYSHTGDAHVAAVAGGGYVVGYSQVQSHSSWLEMTLFNASGAVVKGGAVVSAMTLNEADIAASPLGGFLIVTRDDNSLAGPEGTRDYVTLYDSAGTQVLQTQVTGALPAIDVLSDGTYGIAWTDDGATRSLTIDPRHPPDLSPPATPTVSIVDDVAPTTGTISLNPGWTNDTSIALRVTVSEQGELDVWFGTSNAHREADITIAVTAGDVARGYMEIPVPVSAGETAYSGFARVTDVNGVVSATKGLTLYVDTVAPPRPVIATVVDDSGATTGNVASGGTTDDTTPTVQISLGANSALRFQDKVQLVIDGAPAGAAKTVTFNELQQGYMLVASPALSNGTHTISAGVTDGAGNASALAASYSITVQPDGSSSAGQTYTANDTRDQALTGTSGDDIFNAGHNSVILTGNSGADRFVYQYVPWNNTGHIRDFTSGVDVLDLRALFQSVGYAGSNPVADGYLKFAADGAGGTQVLFDRDGAGSGNPWPSLLTTLDHVQPSGVHSGDWLFA